MISSTIRIFGAMKLNELLLNIYIWRVFLFGAIAVLAVKAKTAKLLDSEIQLRIQLHNTVELQ